MLYIGTEALQSESHIIINIGLLLKANPISRYPGPLHFLRAISILSSITAHGDDPCPWGPPPLPHPTSPHSWAPQGHETCRTSQHNPMGKTPVASANRNHRPMKPITTISSWGQTLVTSHTAATSPLCTCKASDTSSLVLLFPTRCFPRLERRKGENPLEQTRCFSPSPCGAARAKKNNTDSPKSQLERQNSVMKH